MPPLSLTQRIIIGAIGSMMVLTLIFGAVYAGIYFAQSNKTQPQAVTAVEPEKVAPLEAKDLVVPLIPGAPPEMPPFQLDPERGDMQIAARIKPWPLAPLNRDKSVIIALLDRAGGPGPRIEAELAKALRSKGLKQDGSGGFTVKLYTLPRGKTASVEMIKQAVKDGAEILVPLDLTSLYDTLLNATGKRVLYCTNGAPLLPKLPQATGIVLPTVYAGREDLSRFFKFGLPPQRKLAVIFEPEDWASVEYKENMAEFLDAEQIPFECIAIDSDTSMIDVADSIRNRDLNTVWLVPGPELSRLGGELISYVVLSRKPVIGFAPQQTEQGASIVLGPDWVAAIRDLSEPITKVIRGETPGNIQPVVVNSTILMQK